MAQPRPGGQRYLAKNRYRSIYVLELTTKTSFPRWSGRIVSFIGLLDRCRDGNGFEYYSAQPCQLLGGHCVPGGVRGRNSAGNESTVQPDTDYSTYSGQTDLQSHLRLRTPGRSKKYNSRRYVDYRRCNRLNQTD